MPVRFLISTLKPGVDPAEYEAWVRDRDYVLVRSLPNYVSYKVHRIRSPIQGAPPRPDSMTTPCERLQSRPRRASFEMVMPPVCAR